MHSYSTAAPRRVSNRPDSELLDLDTTMGAVTLRVADLEVMTAYYRDGVRLAVLEQTTAPGGEARVVLGHRGVPSVILDHAPGLRHAGPGAAGLFHTAIVYQDQRDLAAAVYSSYQHPAGAYAGAADHAVSQAFYFTDPEGNGVELYWDRERTEWSWVGGHIGIRADPLNVNRFISEHLDQNSLESAAGGPSSVGHIHLCVGDIDTARTFYVKQLGFEITAEIPGALFVSAGGYHHHMAMNTWNSPHAGRRRLALGLGVVRIRVPDADAIGQFDERLRYHGLTVGHESDGLVFTDPWDNTVEIATMSD